jgi:predicted transcriptional regulator
MSYVQPIDPSELSTRFSTDDTLEPIHVVDDSWVLPRLEKIKSVLDRLPAREADLIRLYFFLDKKQMDIAEIFGITQAAVSYRIKRALSRIRFLVEMPDLDKEAIHDLMSEMMHTELDAHIFTEMYFITCQSEVANQLNVSQGLVRHRFIRLLRYMGTWVLDRARSWSDTLEPHSFYYMECSEKLSKLDQNADSLKDEDFEKAVSTFATFLYDMDLETPDYDRIVDIFKVYEVFVRIRYNFNILREVKLPKWSNRPTNTIL